MKKLTFIFTLLFLTVMFSSVSHSKWTKVGESATSGNTWYVDFDRIRKHDDYVYYWELHDYLKLDKYGDMSAINYKQVDCQLLAYKFLSDTYYTKPMGQGSISASSNTPDKEWEYAQPNSVSEQLLKSVCSR